MEESKQIFGVSSEAIEFFKQNYRPDDSEQMNRLVKGLKELGCSQMGVIFVLTVEGEIPFRTSQNIMEKFYFAD